LFICCSDNRKGRTTNWILNFQIPTVSPDFGRKVVKGGTKGVCMNGNIHS
jgi:hypothetical protein